MYEAGRQFDAERMQQLDHVARPAHRHRRRAHRVFQHQVPADDPGQQFAHGGVGVGVRAARDRDHGGEFAVAHAGEGAADGGHHEGEHHRGPGVVGRGDAGQREQARADDRADAQGHQVYRAQRPLQVVLAALGFGHDPAQRFGRKQVHAHMVAFFRQIKYTGTPSSTMMRPGHV